MDKKVITWRGTISLCGRIVKKLKDKYPNILDHKIIGLSRGGLIPAVIISNMLNIRKVYSLGL
jgi:hypoxanthine phosphoribosyltransferase